MPTLSERSDAIDGMVIRQGGGFDLTSEDRAFVAAPPPPLSAPLSPSGGLPPPSPTGGTPPPMAPNTWSVASSPAHRRDVTPDDILSNLEGSEEVLYGKAFEMFPGGRNGFVGLDVAAMRDFICTNSTISMQDVDVELLKVTSPDEGLTRESFLHLLRECSISEGEGISQFLGLSADGESLASEECRSGLMLFEQQMVSITLPDDRWECILNTVMWDAGMSVTMEQWLTYCKLTGRMVRLLRYAQVQKLSIDSQRSRTGGVGGA